MRCCCLLMDGGLRVYPRTLTTGLTPLDWARTIFSSFNSEQNSCCHHNVGQRPTKGQEQGILRSLPDSRHSLLTCRRRRRQFKSLRNSCFEKRMSDKMWLLSGRPMPFSTWRSFKNTRVGRERTLRISYGGIVFVWENGCGMPTGN